MKPFGLRLKTSYDDRYIKTKKKTYGDKVCNNFCGLSVPEDGVEHKSFTVISIDLLHIYDKNYYLQVYLHNYAYKIVDNQKTDYLVDNLFETMKISFFFILINESYKFCVTMI